MNCQAGAVYLWAGAAVLLIAVASAGFFAWKKLRSLKNFLLALNNKAKTNQELLNTLNARAVSSSQGAEFMAPQATEYHKTVMDALGKAILLSGKIRTEMTAYHAAVMGALESKKMGAGSPADTMGENTVPDGKARPCAGADRAAVMDMSEALAPLKTEKNSVSNTILDKVLPINNDDGSTYGFKISLPSGGTLVAVIHSLEKDDLLKAPEIVHYHYTVMAYDANGELIGEKAEPVSEKQK